MVRRAKWSWLYYVGNEYFFSLAAAHDYIDSITRSPAKVGALNTRQIEMMILASDVLTIANINPGEGYMEFSGNVMALLGLGFLTYADGVLFGYTITEAGSFWLEMNDDEINAAFDMDYTLIEDDDEDDFTGALAVRS